MALIDIHDLDELKNANEEPVWEQLEEVYRKRNDLCRCRDCILDSAALALNCLPPRYRVYSFHGNQMGMPTVDEVKEAVAGAIDKVRNRPHHF
jgi:competence protein ComFB